MVDADKGIVLGVPKQGRDERSRRMVDRGDLCGERGDSCEAKSQAEVAATCSCATVTSLQAEVAQQLRGKKSG